MSDRDKTMWVIAAYGLFMAMMIAAFVLGGKYHG